jgi:hypothetical protein
MIKSGFVSFAFELLRVFTNSNSVHRPNGLEDVIHFFIIIIVLLAEPSHLLPDEHPRGHEMTSAAARNNQNIGIKLFHSAMSSFLAELVSQLTVGDRIPQYEEEGCLPLQQQRSMMQQHLMKFLRTHASLSSFSTLNGAHSAINFNFDSNFSTNISTGVTPRLFCEDIGTPFVLPSAPSGFLDEVCVYLFTYLQSFHSNKIFLSFAHH